MAESVDIAQLALAVEDLLGPFARETERLGELTEQFDDLGDVIVVLAILGSRLGVEKVVSRDQFKNLKMC